MINIGIVAQGLSGGGAEKVASILANYFVQRKYNILFIPVYNNKHEYYIEEQVKIIPITTTKKNNILRLVDRSIKIYDILRQNQVDIVISFITNETIYSQIKGIPVIHTLRNDPQNKENGFISSRFRNYAYKHAKHIVFQTVGAQNFFNEIIKQKSSIIENPLDLKNLPYWNDQVQNNTFITACRLTPQKNLKMLIKAFAKLHEKHSQFQLEIYGEGEQKKQLQKLILDLNCNDYIKLMGHTSRINQIMSESFAFILSSNYEGISNSMLEALAIGIPCICTDCPPGGARAFIQNGENGLLTEVGNEEDLVEAMQKLITDRELYEKISRASVNIRENLSIEKVCGKWEKLIQKESELKPVEIEV